MRPRRLLAIATAALLCSTAVACGDDDAARLGPPVGAASTPAQDAGEAPSAEAEPAQEPPSVGECRRLAPRDIPPMTNASPTTSCTGPHTAVTYLVGEIPEGKRLGDRAYLSAECARTYPDQFGVPVERLSLTVFSYAFFTPSKADFDAGARWFRWFRCDVIARLGTERLTPLPAGGLPLLPGGRVAAQYAACLTAQGDTVACNQAHTYRAAGTFTGTGGPDLPPRDRMMEQGRARCPAMTGTEQWYVSWPSQPAWRAGNRLMTCWAHAPR